MKKLTKTIVGLVMLFSVLIVLNACQEDVVPSLQDQETVTLNEPDAKTETDGQPKDEGVKPR